jgi:shikimate dehydrogenase
MYKFGLVGRSLAHSRSKEYFTNKFSREQISDCLYENYPLEAPGDLRKLVIREKDLAGLNVTSPYKTDIIPHLDEVDPLAARIGAVNCIKISRNGDTFYLKGFNTDWQAFRDTLLPFTGLNQRMSLVLGTGGAAKAVCEALSSLGTDYTLVSRRLIRGALQYQDLDVRIISEHTLIINATPAGMFPETGQCPDIPYSYLTSRHYLYDLVYNPEITLFLQQGIHAGAFVKNGMEMLQLQADYSWSIWNY